MKTDYLIIGAGASAQEAISAIRQTDKSGIIQLFSKEQSLFVKRTMLSKTPLKRVRNSGLYIHDEKWFKTRNVELNLGIGIKEIFPEKHMAVSDSGMTIEYRKCIYALGGNNIIPDISGNDKEGIVSIHHEGDLRKLKRLALGKSRVAIIGGGVIGLELAIELSKYDMKVTVLEIAPYLMPGKLDKESSDYLISMIEKIDIRTGVEIKEIAGEEEIRGIVFEDGTVLDTDLIVFACGQRADISLAQKAGLACDRGVIVDSKMKTSNPDIYAAGDCTEYNKTNYALWSQAINQGEVAGINAAGGNATIGAYDHSLVLSEGDVSIFSNGDLGRDADKSYEITREEKYFSDFSINEKPQKALETRYCLNGKLVGAIIIGNLSHMKKMMEEMNDD